MNQKSTYTDFFDKLPDAVKVAWQKAGEETGINVFGIDDEGKLLYLSEFARRYLLADLQHEAMDFFERTTENILKFAKETLEQMELVSPAKYNLDIQKFKDSEKMFYQQLISYLENPES